jgi:hypothetical protein
MRKVSGFVFWMLLGLAVVIVPIACGSSSSSDDGGKDSAPVDMTRT